MFRSHVLTCFPFGFLIFVLLQKGRTLFTFICWEIWPVVILFTSPCSTSPLNPLDRSRLKQEKVTQKNINQNLTVKMLVKLSQGCFVSWHFHMLQRMILSIISAIKTFMSDYLEQFNSNITNQLKTGFSVCVFQRKSSEFLCVFI